MNQGTVVIIMKSLKQFKTVVIAGLAIILAINICLVGVAAGVFYGWMVSPVQWVDMAPDSLSPAYQEDYLRMVIDSFVGNENCTLARERYEYLGENRQRILETIIENPGGQNPDSITAFSECIIK